MLTEIGDGDAFAGVRCMGGGPRAAQERTKQELADVKRELAAMAASQQQILEMLQSALADRS